MTERNVGIDMAVLSALRNLERLINLGIKVLERQFPEAKDEDGENR